MKRIALLAACMGFMALGCAQDAPSDLVGPPIDGTPYLLTEEPQDAQEVVAVRETSADGDPVSVVGRIGGGKNPWVEGQAAFTLVDNSLDACSDIPGDRCPTPWDYCCRTGELRQSSLLVKVVDDNGNMVPADARQLLGVTELSTVVATGKAQRDEAGNLTILARRIYVR